MKPNMTGANCPGQEQQDCLTITAARAGGWDFIHLLQAISATAW
ncbi:hypothetical protein [Commensalibacter oyaizuii]|uniref:Uncharacterized protein n=1 Tax=Commensalibacter oyaizuii TaxID=3043873 RepID=A0ABT6PY84_9PROT|nr:hypothetical protein [Commensalibacter sp. TBRC 16381]MDI2089820.1 hypothetical protein [Commensalibacter sp. TBRC 16381]